MFKFKNVDISTYIYKQQAEEPLGHDKADEPYERELQAVVHAIS